MGKGKGKTKKSSVLANNENGSGEEERLPVRRRGRPTKAHKEEGEKLDEKNDNKLESQFENGNKRKKPCSETEESPEMVDDEDGVGPEAKLPGLTKNVGFRHNRSRRKNKPRRAAEVGVSVCEVCSWLVLRS